MYAYAVSTLLGIHWFAISSAYTAEPYALVSTVNLVGCFDGDYRQSVEWGPLKTIEGGNTEYKYCGCPAGQGVTGIYSSGGKHGIYGLEYMECSSPGGTFLAQSSFSCIDKNVWGDFDQAGTASCDAGDVLSGVYLNPLSTCMGLGCIEFFLCCQFDGYSYDGSGALPNDWSQSINDGGWSRVQEGSVSYVTGLTRTGTSYEDLLDKFVGAESRALKADTAAGIPVPPESQPGIDDRFVVHIASSWLYVACIAVAALVLINLVVMVKAACPRAGNAKYAKVVSYDSEQI